MSWAAWAEAALGSVMSPVRRAADGMRFPRRRPEPGRVGRSQPEVARPRRDGLRAHGDRQGEQVIAERGRSRSSSQRACRPPAASRVEVDVQDRRDQLGIVVGVGRARCPAGQPRNSSIRSSSSARSASRPRWMRDLTVPSETPVISAISA